MNSTQINPDADDYYSRLGVSPDAGKQAIRKAGKRAYKKYHPDQSDSSSARETFLRVKRARDTLSDSKLRRRYDEFYAELEPFAATKAFENWDRTSKTEPIEKFIDEFRGKERSDDRDIDTTSDSDISPFNQNNESSSIMGESFDENDFDDPDKDDSTESSEDSVYDDHSVPHPENELDDTSLYNQEDNSNSDNSSSNLSSDIQETGLDKGDLWAITTKIDNPIITDGSGEVSYHEDRNVVSIEGAFKYEVLVNLETGHVSVPNQKAVFVDKFLRSIRARYNREDNVLTVSSLRRDEGLSGVDIGLMGGYRDETDQPEEQLRDDTTPYDNSKGSPSERDPRHTDLDSHGHSKSTEKTSSETETDSSTTDWGFLSFGLWPLSFIVTTTILMLHIHGYISLSYPMLGFIMFCMIVLFGICLFGGLFLILGVIVMVGKYILSGLWWFE